MSSLPTNTNFSLKTAFSSTVYRMPFNFVRNLPVIPSQQSQIKSWSNYRKMQLTFSKSVELSVLDLVCLVCIVSAIRKWHGYGYICLSSSSTEVHACPFKCMDVHLTTSVTLVKIKERRFYLWWLCKPVLAPLKPFSLVPVCFLHAHTLTTGP